MIGSIPNPKKSFELECSAEQLNKNLKHLPLVDESKTYSLTEDNAVMKMCTFEATETLSLGVFIDVTITSVSDTKCSVEVENRRKVGSFDKSHEVSAAGRHITDVAKLISKVIDLDENKVKDLQEKYDEAKLKKQQGCNKMATYGIVVLAVLVGLLYLIGSGVINLK